MGVRWTRTARFAPGKEAEAYELSARVCAYAKEHFGIDVTWGYVWASQTGTMYWSADYESMGHWEDTSMSMAADEDWGKLLAKGVEVWPDGGNDTIIRLE